jgi:hypothetical protein
MLPTCVSRMMALLPRWIVEKWVKAWITSSFLPSARHAGGAFLLVQTGAALRCQ